MQIFVQALFAGAVNGAAYALIGVGLVLYFRSSRLVNLAHGETFMAAGMVVAVASARGWPLWQAAAVGVVASVFGMLLVERALFRSRLHWPTASLIVLSLGVALVVRGLAVRLAGPNPRSFRPILSGPPVRVFEASLSRQGLLAIAVTALLGVVATIFFRRTVYGQAMTACAENPEVSALLGIDLGRMRRLSFGAAALLGALSALLVVPLSSISYDAGLPIVLRGFVAAAIAEMIRPGRAVLGGFALGIIEAMVGTYANPLLRTPIVFGVIFTAVVLWLSRNVRFGGVARA